MDALSYLESRCSLRRNVLTGEISYAPHRSNDYKPLSKEGINTLILEAGRDGIALTEKLIERYVQSTLIEHWNPAEAWLSTLGEWDGEDHAYSLSQRIITSNPDWGKRFHKWMLQMVAGCTRGGVWICQDNFLQFAVASRSSKLLLGVCTLKIFGRSAGFGNR